MKFDENILLCFYMPMTADIQIRSTKFEILNNTEYPNSNDRKKTLGNMLKHHV